MANAEIITGFPAKLRLFCYVNILKKKEKKMHRWSYFAAVSVAFVLAISIAGANEELSKIAEKVGNLEREIIDYKMARADSWMFWMAAFMTLSAVVVAVVFGLVGVVNSFSLRNFRTEMGENRDQIIAMRDELGRMKDAAMAHSNDIIEYHDALTGGSAGTQKEDHDRSITNSQNRPTLSVPPEVNRLIAQADDFMRQQKNKEAIARWEEVAKLTEVTNPDIFADALHEICSLITLRNDFEATLVAAQRAIEADKNRYEGWLNLGWAKVNLGRNAEALEDFKQALSLKDDVPMIWNNIGLAKCNLGNFADAISDFDKAISLNSEFALAWSNKGWAWLNIGQFASAISDLKISLQFDPYNPLTVGNINLAYRLDNQFEEAIKITTEAINYNPNDCISYNNRGRTWLDMRRFEEARKDLNKAADLATAVSDFNTLAIVNGNLNELERLERMYPK